MDAARGALGENLRALRAQRGLSQEELARIAGVTRETVNKWESGAIGNIRTSNLNTIRSHFGLSVDDLRSETSGLAAQARRSSLADAAWAPVVSLDYSEGTGFAMHDGTPQANVPASVLERHPRSIVVDIPDDSMSRVLPVGAQAIIDPDMSQATLPAMPSGASRLVALKDDSGQLVIRRLMAGSTTALISTDSYLHNEADRIVSLEDLHVYGTVVWYQPARPLA